MPPAWKEILNPSGPFNWHLINNPPPPIPDAPAVCKPLGMYHHDLDRARNDSDHGERKGDENPDLKAAVDGAGRGKGHGIGDGGEVGVQRRGGARRADTDIWVHESDESDDLTLLGTAPVARLPLGPTPRSKAK